MKEFLRKCREVLWTFNLTVMLIFNLFFIIGLVLAVVAGAGWLAARLGWIAVNQLLTPSAVMIVMFSASILLGVSVVVMIQQVILTPIRKMVSAMKRLAEGDFTVRMTCEGWMRPLELREFTAAFNTAAAELGGTELLRKDFIHNFSHEFKTPITSLGGFADLLLEDEEMPAGERREYLQIIRDESKRLAELSHQILALSRVESQTILNDTAPFDLTEQLRQSALMVERKWAVKEVTVRLDGPEEDIWYTGNEGLLKEVWVNLLDNALKFSPEGDEAVLRLRREEGALLITVTDRGPGMDEKTQAHIFEQFYQGDTSHKAQGNGLGLTMARTIVRLHGGEITVHSQPGQGSVFTVRLPFSSGR